MRHLKGFQGVHWIVPRRTSNFRGTSDISRKLKNTDSYTQNCFLWSAGVINRLKACLNGFHICFNRHSTLCWTKWSVRLNRSSNIVENVKKCWKRVESSLHRFKLSFNIVSTFPLFQHLPNIRSAFVDCRKVGQMLKPFKRAFSRSHQLKDRVIMWSTVFNRWLFKLNVLSYKIEPWYKSRLVFCETGMYFSQ